MAKRLEVGDRVQWTNDGKAIFGMVFGVDRDHDAVLLEADDGTVWLASLTRLEREIAERVVDPPGAPASRDITQELRGDLDALKRGDAQLRVLPVTAAEVLDAIAELIDIAGQAGGYAGPYFDDKWQLSKRYNKAAPLVEAWLKIQGEKQ